MKLFLNICLILLTHLSFSQKEADCIAFGRCYNDCEAPTSNGLIYFNENSVDSIVSKKLNLDLFFCSASFKNNNVHYISNGWLIVNSLGDTIDSKIVLPEFVSEGEQGTLTSLQNPLFLSIISGDSTAIYLFYGQYKWIFTGSLDAFDTHFSYARLNALSMDKEVALLSKNNVLLSGVDSTSRGNIKACRHANGRDWWVIKPSIYTNKFYRGLLGPSGIEMKPFYTSVSQQTQNSDCWDHFNYAGTKFYHFNALIEKKLYVYEFDRCTGELSNPIIHDLSAWFSVYDYNANCISEDGTKLYIYRSPDPLLPDQPGGLLQYDLNTLSMTYLGDYSYPTLTPNSKWVVTSSYTDLTGQGEPIPRMDVIYFPNQAGLNCQYQPNQYNLVNRHSFEFSPSYANFRLGPIDGSSCDTLGLNTIQDPENSIEVKIYPNPTEGPITVEIKNIKSEKIELKLFNALGQAVYNRQLTNTIETLNDINVRPGLYILQLINSDGLMITSNKLIIK